MSSSTEAGQQKKNRPGNRSAKETGGQAGHETGLDMLKKLFAAVLCGIVIASIASHADAAGPGGLARSFAKIERNLVASAPSITQGEQVDIERKAAIASLDFYFQRFDQFEKLR